VALGFDFGGTKCAIALGSSDGAVVDEAAIKTAAYTTADALVDAALLRGHALLRGREAAAVGVATMGITREEGVDLAPNVAGWSRLHLPAALRAHFPGVPVRVENDVKAAHRAEIRWGALRGRGPSAYLNLGTGVALSLALDGRIVDGAHGAFGEMAYAWRPDEPGYGVGRAPLEERLGGGALDREVSRRFHVASLSEAFSLRVERADIAGFLNERLAEIGWWVGQALLLLDVEVLCVGGGIARHLQVFGPSWEAQWGGRLPFPPELTRARFAERAGVMGALTLAWEA
jgi:glucokinase